MSLRRLRMADISRDVRGRIAYGVEIWIAPEGVVWMEICGVVGA